tara:strand:- start:4107 stop:5030 length:924 start_codon:yes stop_codon:yes gene_type:complete
MEGALRDLLRTKAVSFRNHEFANDTHGFTSMGVAVSIPDLGIQSNGVSIWHAPAGILPITRSEILRFGIDAPSGFNLILSERLVQSDCHLVDTFNFQILGPEEISLWIGRAVLSGDLIATVRGEENQKNFEQIRHIPDNDGTLVLKPLIEIKSWTTQRGMDGFPFSPLLLAARLWTVSGDLLGPNGESEPGKWTILEDPWSQTIALLDDVEKLQRAPVLRTIEPKSDNWLTEDRLNEELAKVIEQRRRGKYGETTHSGAVRSMLLQKWALNFDRANIRHVKILIPGWAIHLETEQILHGRNGRLYDD